MTLIKEYIKHNKRLLLDIPYILFGRHCIQCSEICRDSICNKCSDDILLDSKYFAFIDAKRALTYSSSLMSSFTFASYYHNSKEVVHLFKYKNKVFLGKYIAKEIYKCTLDVLDRVDIITCVPKSYLSYSLKGWDQALTLSKEVGRLSNKAHYGNLLTCKGPYMRTVHLDKESRLNSAKEFYVNEALKEKIMNKNILIVDDVATTMSTLNACTKALKDNGANVVYGSTFAYTLLDN